MSEDNNEATKTGWTKLYHPRGPLVSLPVFGDTPASMFGYVTALMDAGFVVSAPGLEVGEDKEMVSHVLRGIHEHDGEEIATLLLYAANEAMKWSFLKLYLNNEESVASFETACGVKLANLPLYEGKDKPERDGNKLALKYIVKLPRPISVVFKQNPKWSQEEADAAKLANKIYGKARRVFVRWGDVAAATDKQPGTTAQQAASADPLVAEWQSKLAGVTLIRLNAGITNEFRILPKGDDESKAKRGVVWDMIVNAAKAVNCRFDRDAGKFVEEATSDFL